MLCYSIIQYCACHHVHLDDAHISFYVQDGDTALHDACTKGHSDIAELLVSAFANLSIRNKVLLLMCDCTRTYFRLSNQMHHTTSILHPLMMSSHLPVHTLDCPAAAHCAYV